MSITELSKFIAESPMASSHEHTEHPRFYEKMAPDILSNLFSTYIAVELAASGASDNEISNLLDTSNPDIAGRFKPIEKYWKSIEFTGYAEGSKLLASAYYGIDLITPKTLADAQSAENRVPDAQQMKKILQECANLDHVQIDPCSRFMPIDSVGQDFFFYDINVFDLCNGTPELGELERQMKQEIGSLEELRTAVELLIRHGAQYAVAIKSQHAYHRTLKWCPRSDNEARQAFAKYLKGSEDCTLEDRLCLGDWCISLIAELAKSHNLPFKLHTGYYGNHSVMPTEYIKPGNLCELLRENPGTKFILMHIGYPYTEELLAITKHFPNAFADMCWAWSLNPRHCANFFRNYIHAAPLHKLFVFGGDAFMPCETFGFALQTRKWLNIALHSEIGEGHIKEEEAIHIAKRVMLDNVCDTFAMDKKRKALSNAERDDVEKLPVVVFETPKAPVSISGKA